MEQPLAITGKAEDVAHLSYVMKRAFENDPFHRWLLPSDRSFRNGSHRIFASALKMSAFNGKLLTTSDLAGAAIWTLPNYKPPAIEALKFYALLCWYGGTRLPTLLKGIGLMERHKPEAPHWYLFAIGTDPQSQGSGVGTALIRPILDLCDRDGLAAHLDTNTERNVSFYESRGFRVSGEFDLPDGPHNWAMTREPQ